MHIFPPPLHIGDNEGFDPKKDIFGRVNIAAGLTNLLTSIADPLVVAVDGQWGSGKTVFLKMWVGELRKRGIPAIYFDAFENDYAEDAFTAIASEIIELAEEKAKGESGASKDFLEKALGAGRILLRSALKEGVKAATAGALEAADFKEVADSISSEAQTVSDRYLGELLTKQKEQKVTLRAFREALSTMAATLKEGQDPAPLVLVIDELDRCRPLFALQILERMKHFFSVKGVHFVLGAHLDQLRNSIAVAYGSGIDAHTYLQKFVHLTIALADHEPERAEERSAQRFVAHLVKAFEFRHSDRDVVVGGAEFLTNVAERRGLSLRALERIMSCFALALAHTSEKTFRPFPIIMGLCVLKVVSPRLYSKAKAGLLKFDEAQELFALTVDPDQARQSDEPFATRWWRYGTDGQVNKAFIDDFDRHMARYMFPNRLQIVPILCARIVDGFAQPSDKS